MSHLKEFMCSHCTSQNTG